MTRCLDAHSGAVIDDALSADLAAASPLWVLSQWRPRANHVAVELRARPIVGKKALPAVALTGPDLVATVPVLGTPQGDVVLAVASADETSARSVMRRAPTWGASTLWIGNGAQRGRPTTCRTIRTRGCRPPAGSCCSTTCLWELTHVCFEHPGLLTTPTECTEDMCVTCSRAVWPRSSPPSTEPGAGPRRRSTSTRCWWTRLTLLLIHAGMAIGQSSLGR